jgi:Domain of unknown function (DUF4160)
MQIDPSLHSVADNYKLLTNLVVPRPIAWVTSLNASGVVIWLLFVVEFHARSFYRTGYANILRLLNWRFHYYSDEGMEPPHIHGDTGESECKYWLEPIRLARSRNVSPTELRRIETAVFEHQNLFKEKWHEFFHH